MQVPLIPYENWGLSSSNFQETYKCSTVGPIIFVSIVLDLIHIIRYVLKVSAEMFYDLTRCFQVDYSTTNSVDGLQGNWMKAVASPHWECRPLVTRLSWQQRDGQAKSSGSRPRQDGSLHWYRNKRKCLCVPLISRGQTYVVRYWAQTVKEFVSWKGEMTNSWNAGCFPPQLTNSHARRSPAQMEKEQASFIKFYLFTAVTYA